MLAPLDAGFEWQGLPEPAEGTAATLPALKVLHSQLCLTALVLVPAGQSIWVPDQWTLACQPPHKPDATHKATSC